MNLETIAEQLCARDHDAAAPCEAHTEQVNAYFGEALSELASLELINTATQNVARDLLGAPQPMPTIGDRLPNGAVVLDVAEGTETGVVLAHTGGVQPFVTWRYPIGDPAATASGRYHYLLADAVADYNSRKPKQA